MWKIVFEYTDKSKCTITGKHKDIPLKLAIKYQKQYQNAKTAIYQQYPKKGQAMKPMELYKKIEQLTAGNR